MSEPFTDTRITKIKSTSLDQLVIVLEISFIFLLSYSLITLVDTAFDGLNLYTTIASDYLGDAGIGQLDGGNFERITRVTLIFNLLLFAFSLFFGLWIMIRIYCRDHHDNKTLCEECSDLASYASIRLDQCRYGERKPTCANCPIHCYKREMRAKIKDVMRYSGPKMIFKHPVLAIRHVMDGLKKVNG